jgi:FkbM family methyltransferase
MLASTPLPYDSISLQFADQARKFYYRKNTSDVPVIDLILKRNQYELKRLKREPELRRYIEVRQRMTGMRPLIIDAGANIGASAIFFAARFPEARIIAIEPETSNYELLKLNVEGLSNVQPMRAALSATEGRASVSDPGIGHWGFRTEVATGVENTVPCITVPHIYAQNEAQCFPFFVKIDIEGGECDLFLRDTAWVARTPLLVIELHDWLLPGSANSRTFLQCVSQLNRDFVYIGEDVYSIANDLYNLEAQAVVLDATILPENA